MYYKGIERKKIFNFWLVYFILYNIILTNQIRGESSEREKDDSNYYSDNIIYYNFFR